ncbi:hypothetical protein [Ruminococcus flavefaciens]|uniref:hypothetical protein n=1 Tax=Ruminococcus flavefaciens TaxID=1265 RepID=UPI0026EF654D|nr:hypothetical protein [Ruminococcus flavefaciens]
MPVYIKNARKAPEAMTDMIHIATGIFMRYFSRSFMEAIITPRANTILSTANPKILFPMIPQQAVSAVY